MIQIYVWKPSSRKYIQVSERAIREHDTLIKLDKMFDECPNSHAVSQARTEAYWALTRVMGI